MLNPFYECTLIVSRTTNAGIYLGFRLFDFMFNHLELIEEIIGNSTYTYKSTIILAYELASRKLRKYYSRT